MQEPCADDERAHRPSRESRQPCRSTPVRKEDEINDERDSLKQGDHADLVPLDEAPTVDVDDQTPLVALRSQQIEPADHLPESLANLACVALLVLGELRDEPDLLAIRVAADEAIDDGRLARLGVREGGSDGVDLDVLSYESRERSAANVAGSEGRGQVPFSTLMNSS